MFESELKRIWHSASPTEQLKFEKSKLLLQLKHGFEKKENDIRQRDLREIIVALALIPFFIFLVINTDSLWIGAGAVVLIGFCFNVVYQLRAVKKKKRSINLSSNLKEQLANTRDYLNDERKLLDNVLYWYLLPPAVGILLVVIGSSENIWTSAVYLIVVVVLYTWIYNNNKRAVKSDYDPLIKKLNQSIEELEE